MLDIELHSYSVERGRAEEMSGTIEVRAVIGSQEVRAGTSFAARCGMVDQASGRFGGWDGFDDYVLVSGGAATDSYDVLLFNDGAELTYLLGPTPDTAHRDAFRALTDESAPEAHACTAQTHFDTTRYREAVLAARLAVETACGGRGPDVKRQLADASADGAAAGDALYGKRHIAVQEGDTRVEQPDATQAILAMHSVLAYLESNIPKPAGSGSCSLLGAAPIYSGGNGMV